MPLTPTSSPTTGPALEPRARRASRPLMASALVALGALTLAGCAPEPASGVDPDAGSAATALELSNCGVAVTIDAPPERVITIKSTSTEMLLALGLGDRIIGTAFPDGPVPEEWADAAADLPLVSDRVPGEEAVLELEPDFIYAGWESNFSADGVGERAELAALGIDTYVSPAACRSADVPAELDFEEVFREIAEVAAIFDVDASELIDAQRAELDAIVPDSRGLTALWYSSGSDTPYVGAGTGAPQMVLDAIGLRNIAGDIEGGWTALSWEAVIEADPSVIVLVESDWGSAEKKIAQLEGNPATAQLTAVLGQRYLIVPFAASEAGVRSVSAASDLSAQLAGLTAP